MRELLYRGKAIIVREPWASAIAYAGKNIENRSVRTHYRGPVAIHASSAASDESKLDQLQRVKRGGEQRTLRQWILSGLRKVFGGTDEIIVQPDYVLAIGMLVDCIEHSGSPWFCGDYGYVIEGIIPIDPVHQKGKLGLWDARFKYKPL